MKLVYSELAIQSLEEIVFFLRTKWTRKEIRTLEKDINEFKDSVCSGLVKHQNFEDYPDTKVALIGKKQIKIIYRTEVNRVIIAIFWHCKQNPDRLKNFLKENL